MTANTNQWEELLTPSIARGKLISTSIFITAFEVLKQSIVARPRTFFADGYDKNGPVVGAEYEAEVLSRNKSPTYASLDWLKHLGAINDSDIHIFENRPIGDLCRLMHGAKLIVANDCGPSHLAQFACVPYVTVLHEPNPEWFWDRAYSAFVIPADGSTEIRNVKVDDVTQACQRVLLAHDNQRIAADV